MCVWQMACVQLYTCAFCKAYIDDGLQMRLAALCLCNACLTLCTISQCDSGFNVLFSFAIWWLSHMLSYYPVFYSISCYSILVYCIILYHMTLIYAVQCYSIIFYPVLFYHILLYSILLYSILFHSNLIHTHTWHTTAPPLHTTHFFPPHPCHPHTIPKIPTPHPDKPQMPDSS